MFALLVQALLRHRFWVYRAQGLNPSNVGTLLHTHITDHPDQVAILSQPVVCAGLCSVQLQVIPSPGDTTSITIITV